MFNLGGLWSLFNSWIGYECLVPFRERGFTESTPSITGTLLYSGSCVRLGSGESPQSGGIDLRDVELGGPIKLW
jgi:hypothetical protein